MTIIKTTDLRLPADPPKPQRRKVVTTSSVGKARLSTEAITTVDVEVRKEIAFANLERDLEKKAAELEKLGVAVNRRKR